MLRRIGFRYAERVDPFDGGPHFTAPTDEVSLVQKTHRTKVVRLVSQEERPKHRALLGLDLDEAPYFRAGWTYWSETDEGGTMEAAVAEHLGIGVGDDVWALPLE